MFVLFIVYVTNRTYLSVTYKLSYLDFRKSVNGRFILKTHIPDRKLKKCNMTTL